MSKIKVQSPSSGTAVFTLTTASGTSTDRTITLPDSSVTLGAATPSITDNGNANAITIDSSERVGIGTTTPEGAVNISSTLDADTDFTDGQYYHLHLHNPTDTTDLDCGIGFGISTTVDTIGANIVHERKGSSSYGDLCFGTKPSSGVVTERLRITSDGRGLSQFTAKAWVQLNMSTPAIKDSHNHDTITDISTGHFIVSFTVNVANANYAVSTGVGQTDSAGTSNIASDSFRLFAYNTSGTLVDSTHCMAVTFGD